MLLIKRLLGFICLVFCLNTSLVLSQNLINNSSFETYSSVPTGPGQWSRATSWSNVNGWIPFQWPYASPDYCHALGSGNVKLPNTVFGTVNAYHGNAVMGMIMYYPSTFNFREYLATQLTTPMVIGNDYTVSFYVTSGIPATIGGIGIANFGVCLSSGMLTQVDHEPILVTPQYTAGVPFYSATWQLVSFNITATQAWDHITFGNFDTDANTVSQVFVATSSPGAYYFFDSVVVEEAINLPIELMNFEAELIEPNEVELTWSTASEADNDFFTVERSSDAINWSNIMEIDGAGNSTEELHYLEIDREPLSGTSFYRIKQTDFNGQFEHSQVRTIHRNASKNSELFIYPNPTEGNISIIGKEIELKGLTIFSNEGKNLTEMISIKTINGGVTLDLSKLSSGVYILKTKSQVHKVFKE